ncbi:MbtH family protein [Rhodospirillum sp. A1_3_36]|uniref:MbtH family protein n=1 Tax=Rhodospirillum sp. A1_3_36 TaxID=3391666 RepID=UPI0039A7586A
MPKDELEGTTRYIVVINHEEQYSIWPEGRELPLGWSAEGKSGSRAACLEHINAVWTDMRPLSLRRQMEALADAPPTEAPPPSDDGEEDGLVHRLAEGSHPVEIALRLEKTAAALREAVERGYVYVRFPETRGGTELGIRLDHAACDLSGADFATGTGRAKLVGGLTLDFTPVRCVAEVDLATLGGSGRLEIVT